MNCPVCHASDLSDGLNSCPHCKSDLEAFLMTEKIDKSSKNRLILGVIASVLFVLLLIFWLFSVLTGKSTKPDATDQQKIENASLKTDLQTLKSENDRLNKENKELNKKIIVRETENQKRTKEYVVKNGETLYGIARNIYGNGFKYMDLAKDNNIEDPNVIRTGQKLTIYY